MNMDNINIELWIEEGYIMTLNELGLIPRQGERISVKNYRGMYTVHETYLVKAVEYAVTVDNNFTEVKLHVEEI